MEREAGVCPWSGCCEPEAQEAADEQRRTGVAPFRRFGAIRRQGISTGAMVERAAEKATARGATKLEVERIRGMRLAELRSFLVSGHKHRFVNKGLSRGEPRNP